jgi:hypothetical protein
MAVNTSQPGVMILNYASRERRRVVPRWAFKALVVGLGVIAAIGAACSVKPRVVRTWDQLQNNAQRKSLFQQCLSHTYPASALVFDESVDTANLKIQVDGKSTALIRPPAVTLGPSDWDAYQSASWASWPAARNLDLRSQWRSLMLVNGRYWLFGRGIKCVSGIRMSRISSISPLEGDEVFVHGRQAHSGEKQLVVVGLNPVAFSIGSDAPFRVNCVTYAGPFRGLRVRWPMVGQEFRFAVPPDQPLKLYAGQPDPIDESHFTIAYETPAGRGTIDGWLMPDDSVKLQVRDGPAK